MLMDFNDSTLYEPVNNKFFVATSSGSDTTVNITNLGYEMKQGQYLTCRNIAVDTDSSGFSFCFWLYPNNPGQVSPPSGGGLETLRRPLLIFSDPAVDFAESVLTVYENTNADGTNKIELKLSVFDPSGSTSSEYIVYSDSYSELTSHHFLFNICVEKSEVQIFIDGVDSVASTSGSLPSTFIYNSLDVGVNKIAETEYAYNLSSNTGYIDDIGFFNLQFDADSILPKLINEGLEEFADLDLRNDEDFLQGNLFDDPTTLKINAMIDDMSYVYLARNDGKILFGSPLLWESRRLFSDDRELSLLDDTLVTDGEDASPAIIENGFLKITDSIVRL
jgi:hypothetical protein